MEQSRWFDIVSAVVRGEPVSCQGGGKEVHAADVAKTVGILLRAKGVAGEVDNCCDRYVSQHNVATIAKRLAGSTSVIQGQPSSPRHQIVTAKLRAMGMEFGGPALLEETIAALVATAKATR